MPRRICQFLIATILCAGSPVASCFAEEAPAKATPATPHLSVFPESVRLDGRDSRQQLLVTLQKDQRTADVTRVSEFRISDPAIATVDAAGVVTPRKSGSAELAIRHGGITSSIRIEIANGDVDLPLSFDQDIVPILTRRGCNGGGCHGKATGRGGFKLSLFGYDPESDFASITRDSAGRRVTTQHGAASLLLQKPVMDVPHGGGKRLSRAEPEFVRLARWIENETPRALPDLSTAPTFQRLTLEPAQRSLLPEAEQQIVAMAHFSDGSVRDVTRLVEFKSNESTIAEVDEWGLVKTANRIGETAVVATYSGQVAVSRIRVPLDRPWTTPDFPIRNSIDDLVLSQLRSLGIPPSAECNDEEFIRRATQQIAGRLPTVEELAAFAKNDSATRREQLVQTLLDDPGYADHFAQKWSDILRNKRRGQGPRIPGTIAFHRWIRNAIAENVPYDHFVRGIVTATGNVSVNPPAQWYAEVRYLDRYVDDSAQLFLGMRIGCARCHHHPFEKISQEDYYGIAAFFGRVDRKGGAGVEERRADEAIFVKPSGDVKHPLSGEVVAPHGLGQATLDIPPFADPRHDYVDWMADPENPYFARAFVNRMWGHFFGRGLVDPIDDLRVTNPASNEALLDELALEFVKSGFNMKHIVELICTSTTYMLSSEPNEFNLDETQNFSRFYPQRMKAEVLLDSIDQATGVATGYGGLPAGTRALQLPDEGYSNSFLTLFGRPPRESACECERAADPSLSQALHFMNDNFVLGKVASGASIAAKLAADKREHSDKVTQLFETVFSRKPTAEELANAVEYLKSETDQKKGYGNVLWALINTKEFQFVH
ncbi:MAG: hypothetical protein ACI8P0_003512 [Planctomycetaceae bacterium]|jgi:hypothetical protein